MKSFTVPILAALLGIAALYAGPLLAAAPEVATLGVCLVGVGALVVAHMRDFRAPSGIWAQLGEVTDMTPEKLREVVLDTLKTHNSALSDAIKKCDEQQKEQGKISDDLRKELADLGKKGTSVEEKVAAELKKIGDLEARLAAAEQKLVASDGGRPLSAKERKSFGEKFVESAEFKAFRQRMTTDDKPTKEFRKISGRSDELVVGTFWGERKDITSLDASAGAGIWSIRQPEIVSEPYRPLSIRNLIPSIPVTSNLIEYVRTLVRTSAVDYVSEGAAKPKSDLTYERAETAVRKIAHYIKASMEVLADFPRLQSLINTELLQMLKVFEEDQLLLGDGTGDTILGLIPQATPYDTTLTRAGDTRLDLLRHAILQVRQSFYPSTGIVLNPLDWERIELTKDGDGRYLIASATSTTSPRLWGLPVVESDAMPVGQFLVGAYALAAEIYDRMVAAILVSTEDQDNFIRNMVSILAEERLGLAVKRPLAFVHGDFDDAGLSSGAA